MGADLPGPWEPWEELRACGVGHLWWRGSEARRGCPRANLSTSQGKSRPGLREVKAAACLGAPSHPEQLPKRLQTLWLQQVR